MGQILRGSARTTEGQRRSAERFNMVKAHEAAFKRNGITQAPSP
jgi:hypothetical protein